MAKTYFARFGTGNPSSSSGLSPTFIYFRDSAGNAVTPPAISELSASSGIYSWTWSPTLPIAFVLDGATTGLATGSRYVVGAMDPSDMINETGSTLVALGTSLVALGTTGVALGTTNVALGTTNVALGTTNVALGTTGVALGISGVALGTSNFALGTSIYAQGQSMTVTVAGIGTAGSTIGGSATDPIDLFGYMKRALEFWEGNAAFNKTSGAWGIYSRGSSILLRSKTLTNATDGITKS